MTQNERTSQNGSSAADDQQTALAIEQSKKIQESYDNYLKFYASRIILKVPNEQN